MDKIIINGEDLTGCEPQREFLKKMIEENKNKDARWKHIEDGYNYMEHLIKKEYRIKKLKRLININI